MRIIYKGHEIKHCKRGRLARVPLVLRYISYYIVSFPLIL